MDEKVYQIVGYLIIANIGALVGAIGLGIKLVWHLAHASRDIKDAKDCSVRAHRRLDRLNAPESE